MRTLVAIPVFNEQKYVCGVLREVQQYASDVLFVDDGSTDATPALLEQAGATVLQHERNFGYGQSLCDAFAWAAAHEYDWIVTMDCDEQHEPASIPAFLKAIQADDCDIVSGSRYLDDAPGDTAPGDRRAINRTLTAEIRERLGLEITDAFCGFKAHRVAPIAAMQLDESGYAFPMQLWVRSVAAGLRVREIPVKRIYIDPTRSFGGDLDDANIRLAHYRHVLQCEMQLAGMLDTPQCDISVPSIDNCTAGTCCE